ncbi:hypothetical protein MKW94_023381, partial [Papaver nudicaule]|nr:hypothetical protein [Papaver nudicaule]
MGQMEYGQENPEQVIPVGKEKDEELELEVEVDTLIRTNSKQQQQQQKQLGVGENDILNMVTSAVHDQQEEPVLPQLNTKAAKEDENPDSLPSSSSSSSSSDQKSVYFDEIQGAVSSNGTNETSEIGSPSAELSPAGKAPTKDELEVKVSNPNAERSLVNGTNFQETLKNEIEQTGLHVENLVFNVNSSVKLLGNKHVQFGEVQEVEEVEESNKEEVIEWDVERVIKEQDTHDLICPNCKACITERVILRKRKRPIPITGTDVREPKRSGTPPKSILKTDPSTSSGNRGHDSTEPGAPDTNERRNDVFRCFSCFSFFIPT